jgi:hypothetical protein
MAVVSPFQSEHRQEMTQSWRLQAQPSKRAICVTRQETKEFFFVSFTITSLLVYSAAASANFNAH